MGGRDYVHGYLGLGKPLNIVSIANELRKLESGKGPESTNYLRSLAREFEYNLLGSTAMPDEYVDCIVSVLSSRVISQLDGSEEFVLNALMDVEKTSESQRRRILSAIVDWFHTYKTDALRFAIAEYISRCFPENMALATLENIGSSASKDAIGSIRMGLEVLLFREGVSSEFRSSVFQVEQNLLREKEVKS